jgi:hypothetical protein
MGGQSGSGNNKSGGSSTNTGQPAWSSGATGGYTPPWGNSNVGGGATTAPQGGAQAAPGATGIDPNQDPSGYNAMNTSLTTAPMQALTNLFAGGGANPQTNQAIQNLLGTSGSNNAMNQAGSMFQNLGGAGTQNFQNTYNAAAQPGANQQYLQNYASGNEMMNNPYIDAIAQKNKQDAATNVNQMYAAGGRYGSGYNQDAMTNAVGNVNNQLYGQEYENSANRQLTAANQMSQEQTNRLSAQNTAAQGVGGLQTSAAQGLGSLGNSAMQNWLTAQQNAGTLGTNATQNMLQGMGQLNNVQNNKMFDANQQLGVGNQMDQQTQAALTNYANQFTQGDMADWARTGALSTAGTQTAGNWGTQTGNQKQTAQAGWGSILGGILGMI